MRFLISLVLLVAVAGCSGSSSNTETEHLPASAEASKSTVVKEKSATDGAVLTLSVDGLSIANKQSGKTRTIPFDTDITTSTAAVASALGEPIEKTQNSECGAGPMNFVTWSNGLTMNATQNRFVGWTVRQDSKSANLTTADGIGLGTTLADLKANYSVETIEDSLGTEFYTSNNLFGLLSANEPNGVIIYLWSGIACNFR